MTKRLLISALFILALCYAQGQEYNNLRKKVILLNADTITFDTLSIIPRSIIVKTINGEDVDPSLYQISSARAKIIVSSEFRTLHNRIYLEYRVFPLLLEKEFSNRDYKDYLSPDSLMGREPPRYAFGREQEPIFGDQIQTNGSIMRGIRFGNNQNLSVNSSMNLSFSGELGNNLMIEGAISDQDVPIQPEGTTRRLEEFDRIYLRVYRENFSIQAGDIEMRAGGNGQLLSFARNVQGLAYDGLFTSEEDTLLVKTALAVPKGKYARNQIQGNEGNQGPYRLQGTNGEPFIIILSGSEKVYVDGILLTRGENEHYIIDYNAAEVTFTHRMPINRNSRIQVEFEYSERSYARFNTIASVQNRGEKWQWQISAFAEQDSRNQPFDQELTDDQKQHLAAIGDNLSLALYPQEDKVDFDPEKILYQKTDTLVNGEIFSIYKYSNNPSEAEFRVYFTFMGPGNGNYVPDFGSANGRVYRWVAPLNGEFQGSYEPVRRLVAPQKSQMVQAGLSRLWGKGSLISANYALSNTDLNTFSQLDADDNIGHGIQLAIANRFDIGKKSTKIGFGANILKTTDGFQDIDRFRPVEFERDWSINSTLTGGNEQMIGGWAEVEKPQKSYAKVSAQNFRVGSWYNGSKGSFSGWNKNRIVNSTWNGSIVNASDTSVNSIFYRANVELSHTQGFVNFRLLGELENSVAKSISTDSLLSRSFSWYQLKALAATPDTLSAQMELSYAYREDYKPFESASTLVGSSQEFALKFSLDDEKAGRISTSIGYRIFNPNQEVFTDVGDRERTALARLEYSNRFLDGFWVLSGGYELGSGLEPDAEFYFIEVPAGQGAYAWVDYNENGIRELNEFEIANFPDEARFIRINIPGSKMISVRNNAFSVRSNLNPAALLKDNKGIVKQIGRFSNQTSYRIQQKNRFSDFWESANPFVQNPTDTLITSMSSNIRNSFAYNRTSRDFGLEYIFMQGLNKSILANGFEQKEVQSNRIIMWIGLGDLFTTKTEGEAYSNDASSQFFTFRNYLLAGYNAQQSLKYLSSKQHTVEVGYRWNNSLNELNNEELTSQTLFLLADFVFANKGAIMTKGSYVSNNFIGNSQSAVAYEMMKGLQQGKNIIWEVAIKRRLTKLFELELGYNGRYLNNGKIVHSGAMQARALF